MEESANHRPLRVLMTTDTVGGVWTYSLALCKALHPCGVHIYLVTTGALMKAEQKQEAEMLENVTVYETGFLLEWMEAPWASIDASADWLLQLEAEVAPHLVHINGYAYGSLPWKAPVLVVAHSDVFSWWSSVKGGTPPDTWHEYFQRVRHGLQEADLLIAPSQAMMNHIRRIYGVSTPGRVIYNGVDLESFHPGEKAPFIFSMGRIWDEAKNVQLLVNASPHIGYPVRVAGDQSFAGNHSPVEGAPHRYLGKLPSREIAAELSAATLYVLPALYEPFGLSVLEAALSGCVLVLGNIDSLQEIWGDSAVYVDPSDAQALADTINNLMSDEPLRWQYIHRSGEQAKRYSSAAMAAQYMQAYAGLLQPGKNLKQPEIV